MADIAEQICLAVDQIVTERLKSINFDHTEVATIIDNTNAKDFQYTCSNGSAQYVAYSKDTTFKINDSVQVTIPNNDYTQQKIIIGRYVAKGATPYVFTQPFNTIIDVSTNLFDDNEKTISGNLLANEDYDLSDFNTETNSYEIFKKEVHLWNKVFNEGQVNFNRLGLQGQFRSWVSSFKTVSGNYGYRLEVLSSNGTTIETQVDENDEPLPTYEDYVRNVALLYSNNLKEAHDNTLDNVLVSLPDLWYDKIKDTLKLTTVTGDFKQAFIADYNKAEEFSQTRIDMIYALLYANTQITDLYLDSSDMFGNPYNFQTYFEEEKVYDITSLGKIMGLFLFFYEKSGTFYNQDKEYIPYFSTFGSKKLKLNPNLFTKDPYVCLGYDLSGFKEEQAILYSLDGSTYINKDNTPKEKNRKHIRLRWLHEYDNGQIKVVTEASELEDYEIRWYRFLMGAPSADEYSGVYWERVNVPENDSTNEDPFSYLLEPRPNTDSEQVKAIVLYDGKVIRSNIITFYSEMQAANVATAELLAGLSIWCKDNSYGNYCIYGQNNNLLNESKTNEILTLEARFADRELLQNNADVDKESPPLTEAREIQWEFPLNGTMIILHGFNYSYENEIRKAITNNDGEVERIKKAGFTIDYKECLVDGALNLSKLHDIDPTGEIFKLDGYYNAKDSGGNSSEWISVLGNIIRIIRPAENLNVNNIQQYRIAKTYSASKFNNTVKCTIHRDGLIYSTAKELTFGIMGTNGTDATLVIDFNNNKTALTANEKGEAFKVTAHLYDFNHEEVDFNNSGLDLTCEWSWLYYKEFSALEEDNIKTKALEDFQTRYPEEYLTLTEEDVERIKNEAIAKAASIQIQTDPENEPPNVCFITHEDVLDLSKKFFLVLQVTIKGFGDYDLTSYKAIPIRANPSYRYIIGPTDIVYNSSGYADYYKDPYQMWWSGGEENVNEYDMVIDETKLSMLATTWRIYDPFFETDPKRPDETVSRFIGTVSERNILQPAAIYVKDAKPYGVVCYLNVEGAENSENLCWIQPLTIIQNQYPSTTLNKWDGKTVEIDYENGTIVSPAIAAGKKNSDNTFSGVMIGDWSNTDTATDISKQTGVYGFNHGAMSFSFAEDGTAFIGKSGRGRIMFDGNSGILKSASWTDIEKTGMYLDLDDGILKLQKDPGYEIIELTADTYSANQYYILKGYYPQVPHNTKFGEDFKYIMNGIEEDFDCNTDTVYYKQGIVPTGIIVAVDFAEIKKDAIYIKSRPTYRVCTKEEPFVYETIYYKYSFSDVNKETLTAEKYSENKYNMYYTKTADDTYVLAGKTFSASTQYYTPQFVPTTTCIEEFNKNQNKNFYIKKNDETAGDYYELAPENSSDFSKIQYYEKRTERAYLKLESLYNKYTDFYYIQVPGSYIKITTSDFNTAQTYYKNGYEAQDYSYKMPDEKTWNQFDISNKSLDSNLHDDEYYYTFFDQFTIASGSFDPNITYYEKNEEASARYITLSAAASRYPLAIGDNSSEQFRKFRVEWDGTCWIEDGMFTGTITANDGVLGNLEVRGELTLSAYGALAANKRDLLDFSNPGFYLNGQGLNIGSSANYFLATTSYTGFYNGNGGLRVSGTGLDLYADVSASAAYTAFSTGAQGLVHLGWTEGANNYPYIRFGRGNEGISTAGLVKKYGGGMWIGDYGSNVSDNNPAGDGEATKVGLFCCTNGHGLTSHTVYRCEVVGGTRVFEPARYARFAPG